MRVAAYYPWIYLRGGAERLILETLRRSRHDWTLFTNRYDRSATFPEFTGLSMVELPRVSVRRTPYHVGRAALTLLLQRLPFRDFDAVMVVSESIGSLVALRTRKVPLICLCLTPLRVAFDPITRQRFLDSRPGLLTRASVGAFAWIDRLGWKRYSRVFAISGEVASRLTTARLVAPDRIEVTYPGVDLDYFAPNGRSEPFFLLPGRIMWTKNLELGVRAFLRLREADPAARDFRLVVAGVVDEKSRPYLAHLQQLASRGSGVEFVVDPSDALYRELHQRCFAVLFTPLNEDWGFVPLEAMATEKPVIAVAQGGPQESVADGRTGFLVPPRPQAFAAAMSELIHSPTLARRMGSAGRDRAGEFSWDKFVDRIDDYLDGLHAGAAASSHHTAMRYG